VDGHNQFFDGLTKNTSLIDLNYESNKLIAEFKNKLVTLLEKNSSLKRLNINDCVLDQQDYDEVVTSVSKKSEFTLEINPSSWADAKVLEDLCLKFNIHSGSKLKIN
jgi:Ran GTPase-activating protein (RanGAP) involved in mRNA processing and transport